MVVLQRCNVVLGYRPVASDRGRYRHLDQRDSAVLCVLPAPRLQRVQQGPQDGRPEQPPRRRKWVCGRSYFVLGCGRNAPPRHSSHRRGTCRPQEVMAYLRAHPDVAQAAVATPAFAQPGAAPAPSAPPRPGRKKVRWHTACQCVHNATVLATRGSPVPWLTPPSPIITPRLAPRSWQPPPPSVPTARRSVPTPTPAAAPAPPPPRKSSDRTPPPPAPRSRDSDNPFDL